MVSFTIRAIFTMIRDRRIENNSAFFIIKHYIFNFGMDKTEVPVYNLTYQQKIICCSISELGNY